MNCETIAQKMPAIIAGRLSATELADCRQHISACSGCRDAMRGAEALSLLARHHPGSAPPGLLPRILSGLDRNPKRRDKSGFWLGTGFGAAIAASLLVFALNIGWIGPDVVRNPATPEFVVTVGELRKMDVAIETDRELAGADISVLLSGAIELDGYGSQRELSWKTDLKPGINHLSLPVRALNETGGRLVVRLNHPDSEQVFVVDLKTRV